MTPAENPIITGVWCGRRNRRVGAKLTCEAERAKSGGEARESGFLVCPRPFSTVRQRFNMYGHERFRTEHFLDFLLNFR